MESKSFAQPKRREILIAHRDLIESQQSAIEQKKIKEKAHILRAKRRESFSQCGLVKFLTRVGGAFWAIAVSILLTLFASYLVANPQVFNYVATPIVEFFQLPIAGAAPVTKVSIPLLAKDLPQSQVFIESVQNFPLSYRDKEDLLIKEMNSKKYFRDKNIPSSFKLQRIEVTPVIKLFSEPIDIDVQLDDLMSNDLSQLPETMQFSVRSDEKMGEEKEQELVAAEWFWEVLRPNSSSLPKSYSAHFTYRGTEHYLDFSHLQVKAFHVGSTSTQASANQEKQNVTPKPSGLEQQTADTVEIVIIEPEIENQELSEDDDLEPSQPNTFEQSSPEVFLPPVKEKPKFPMPVIGALVAATLATAGGSGGAAVFYYRRRKKSQNKNV